MLGNLGEVASLFLAPGFMMRLVRSERFGGVPHCSEAYSSSVPTRTFGEDNVITIASSRMPLGTLPNFISRANAVRSLQDAEG